MIAIPNEMTHSALDVSIWVDDHELGTCFLDAHGQLRAQAMHAEDQEMLDELLRAKYAFHKKRAHREGDEYSPTTFLVELPRVLRGYCSARRIWPQPITIPAPFPFKRFDPSMIPDSPRRRRQRA